MVTQQFALNKLSAAMRIPEWIYGLAIPVGCGFMGYYAIIVLLRTLRKMKKMDGTDKEKGGTVLLALSYCVFFWRLFWLELQ